MYITLKKKRVNDEYHELILNSLQTWALIWYTESLSQEVLLGLKYFGPSCQPHSPSPLGKCPTVRDVHCNGERLKVILPHKFT